MTAPTRFDFRCFALAAVVGLSHVGAVDAADQAGVVEDSFVYKSVDQVTKDGNQTLRIDWIRPADWQATDTRGAVVFFHGGGWTGGTPGQFTPHGLELAQRGLVTFHVEYRLLPKKNNDPPTRCVEDASDAFRTIRRDAAQFGIDPDRIAAGGGSAGGHLAAFLGMMDDDVVDGVSRKPNALLLFNPVYDNGPGGWGTSRVGDDYKTYSPRHNLSADDPPAIVFLGTEDKLIPVATGENFRDDSRALGLRSELHLYEGRSHGFFNAKANDSTDFEDTLGKSIEFLESLDWFDTAVSQ